MEQFLRFVFTFPSSPIFSIRIGIKKKIFAVTLSRQRVPHKQLDEFRHGRQCASSFPPNREQTRCAYIRHRVQYGSRSWQRNGKKLVPVLCVPLIHVEAVTIQFHDDNQRCKSRLQYRNPRRPRTRYRGVVLDSFLRIRSAFGTGVRVSILLRALITLRISPAS